MGELLIEVHNGFPASQKRILLGTPVAHNYPFERTIAWKSTFACLPKTVGDGVEPILARGGSQNGPRSRFRPEQHLSCRNTSTSHRRSFRKASAITIATASASPGIGSPR